MKGFFLFRWIGEFFNFIWRLVLTTLIFLLYALQISRFAFDGRSSGFISLYYLLILSLPVLIKNLVGKNLHARILSLLFLPCELILLFWLFGGVLDLLTIIWVAVTTILFLLRETVKKDYAFSPVAIPYLTLALCAYLLFTTLYEKDYLFWNVGKGCKNVVYFAEMPDVSDKVKEISESREYFVLNDKICVLGEGKYDFRLRPIYNKCFSQGIYKCQTTADLEETVFEIQYVSRFKAHRARNYAVGFGEGVVKTAWDQFSSLVNMVIHPIDTLIGLWKAVKHLVSTLFSSPLDLIPSPAKMLSEHLDEIGDKIAAANNIDKDRIILPETLQVIKEQRILYLAGEIGLVVAEIAVPLPKVGVSEKMSVLGVSILKRLGIAKKGGEVVKLPHPYIKPPNKLTRELEKVAEREAADVGDRVVTKGIEDIRPYPSARLPQEVTRELEKAAEREAVNVGDKAVTKGVEDVRIPHSYDKPPNKLPVELKEAAERDVEKVGREAKPLGKKEFEKGFVETVKKSKDIEYYPETALKGGGTKGTRRADHALVNNKAKTKTHVESKSEKEIRTGKPSWCYYNDYLSECRQKVLNKFGGSCTNQAAWLIVIGCQANSNRKNQFKDDALNKRYKNYKQLTGIHIPKERLDEVIEALKAAGLKETDYVVKEVSEGILIELPEQSMDIISKFIR